MCNPILGFTQFLNNNLAFCIFGIEIPKSSESSAAVLLATSILVNSAPLTLKLVQNGCLPKITLGLI